MSGEFFAGIINGWVDQDVRSDMATCFPLDENLDALLSLYMSAVE
jgi:hypothetical protein